MEKANCKLCSNTSKKIFLKTVLNKYEVAYYQCQTCFFLQTEEPFWLEEAYSLGAISALDTGILYRNLLFRDRTPRILLKLFKNFNNFSALDYGGGEGVFVRLMRDLGFNFYRQDKYADNLYARFFDIKDLPRGMQFNVLTAFEVFEHLPDPLGEIEKMFRYSDMILFSTELQPSNEIQELEEWWYIAQETGQHVSFYTQRSFEKIANITNTHYYSDSKSLHILSKNTLQVNLFEKREQQKIKKSLLLKLILKLKAKLEPEVKNTHIVNFPKSLTIEDFEYVKKQLGKG